MIIKKLEQIESGEIKRLMIFVPPRHGKSEIASIQFPAWYLGRNPNRSIITSSYSIDLAWEFGRRSRNLIGSDVYGLIFPSVSLAADSKSAGRWNVGKRGSYVATGVGGAITGRGANVFLIDDPVKNREEADSEVMREKVWNWYTSTARTRLTPNGAIVLIMTRWHDDDLAGRILASEGGQDWTVINLPAIAEEDEEFRKLGEPLWADMYTMESLMETKRDIGSYDWSALYQQNPVDVESQVFKEEWFRERDWEEVRKLNTRNFLTIDPAPAKTKKADFIGVCENYVDSENNWNLIAYRMKDDPKGLIDLLFKKKREMNFEKVGIEEGTYNDVLKPFLEDEMKRRGVFFEVVTLKHREQRKELRIRGLLPRYQSKTIYHITGACRDLEEELIRFPNAKNDDVCDATAYQPQIAERATPEGQEEDFGLYKNQEFT